LPDKFQVGKGKFNMKSNYIRYIRLLFLGLIVCMAGLASASDSINWRSYEEGMVLSKIEKKKVFLHFWAEWCGFCRKMAKDTFQDSKVVSYLNENFMPVRVNTDREPETAGKYGVMGLPLTVFLTEMGEPIFSLPGYIPPDSLVPMLKEINGISTGG
jgi:thioredoxin-related protein